MTHWPDNKTLKRLGINVPIIQAPMAGVDTPLLATEVSNAGGLGSLACAMLTPDQIRDAWRLMRERTDKPINLNFFCHKQEPESAAQQAVWNKILALYYVELGIKTDKITSPPTRAPFSTEYCAVVEELRPQVTSFHFGLPSPSLVKRCKNAGAVIMSSATTTDEAKWLEDNGCDFIIAQGNEAGGHRGIFLSNDLTTQTNLTELLPAIIKAVSIPVIAAGGLMNAAHIKQALEQGALAVQLGTAYLFCPEANVSPLYRAALKKAKPTDTVLTNVFSGRPARGINNRFISEVGPLSSNAPDFPYASRLTAPLRRKSEELGKTDFMQMWAGQGAALGHEMPAGMLTTRLAEETLESL